MATPANVTTRHGGHIAGGRSRARVSAGSAYKRGDAGELKELRLKVRRLEARNAALEARVGKLTASLAQTLLRNAACFHSR